MIKVLRGNPTPEELAAALAVVQARAAAVTAAAPGQRVPDEWADPARTIPGNRVPHPGPHSWRTSYWPA
ncbi:acyl-CoA carboxylase subunit epsilon [Streptomyces pactum]|uniref:acyl-CoA carboxylase subunit epsilon n=1 Tax=Streptomyces pactum TaxID=68249 RepID=UPI0037017D76